jgi:hypothetical protein
MLDAVEDRSLWHEPETFRSLRKWLERALQLSDRVFDSASDANAALSDVKEEPARASDHPSLYLSQARAPQEAPSSPPLPTPGTTSLRVPEAMYETYPAGASAAAGASASERPPRRTIAGWLRDTRVPRWAVAAVGVLAIGEGAFIGRLLLLDSSARAKPAAAVSPLSRLNMTPLPAESAPASATTIVPSLTIAAASPPIGGLRPAPSIIDISLNPAGRVGATPATASTDQRRGGFRISAPVEVHVLDGERLLGSSADGPIIAAAGRHEFEFVNSAIGYRARRVVDVKAGEITSVSVSVPDGMLNVNAIPWAAVWIDGTSYGETPLGNLSVAPGEHEVVFRHPQFGERREKATVRAETTTHVAVNFR